MQPANIDSVCAVFKEKPNYWYKQAKKVLITGVARFIYLWLLSIKNLVLSIMRDH